MLRNSCHVSQIGFVCSIPPKAVKPRSSHLGLVHADRSAGHAKIKADSSQMRRTRELLPSDRNSPSCSSCPPCGSLFDLIPFSATEFQPRRSEASANLEMDQVEVDNKEDRRSRRDALTEKLGYLAIHKAPNKWTMQIRKRRESLDQCAHGHGSKWVKMGRNSRCLHPHPRGFRTWVRTGSGTVARTASRVLRTTLHDPVLNQTRTAQFPFDREITNATLRSRTARTALHQSNIGRFPKTVAQPAFEETYFGN